MAQNKGYMAKIGLDTSDVDKKMRSLTSELRQIDRALKDNGDSAELNAQKYTVLQQQLAATQKKLQQLQQQEAAAKEALNNGQIDDAEYRAYRREVENTTRAVEDLTKAQKGLGDQSDQAGAKLSEFGAHLAANLSAAAIQKAAELLAKLGAAAVDMVKDAAAAYGQYEQLVGGVETLFGDAGNTVVENARNAFTTAGISANKYMEQVTSFSASLINSLAGDTQAAAELADQAIIDMSDNANKMGTDMQSIQNAYQGFAKQNYTMLDNLKLGYGGTKTEMERLIEDANKLKEANGEAGDLTIKKFSDVVEAIHLVQEQMGISGTTAEEAAKTIEGSAGAAQAAWENLLAGLADPAADIGDLLDKFVNSKMVEMDNLLPTIERSIDGLGQAVEQMLPKLSAGGEIFEKLTDELGTKMPDLIMNVGESMLKSLPLLMDAAFTIAEKFVGFVAEKMPELIPELVEIIGDLLTTIISHADEIATAALKLIQSLSEGLINAIPQLLVSAGQLVAQLIESIWQFTVDGIPKLMGIGDDACGGIAQGLMEFDWSGAVEKAVDRLSDSFKEQLKNNEDLAKLFGYETQDALDAKLAEAEARLAEAEAAKEAAIQGAAEAETAAKVVDAKVQGIREASEAQAEAYKAASEAERGKALAEVTGKIDLSRMENAWDRIYHWDKENYEEYWHEQRKWLEEHKENTKEWWDAWNKNEEHYRKEAADEEKKRNDEAARRQKENEKAERERIAKERADLKEYFSSLEDQKDDKGEKWLLDRQKEYLDTLDESSDLYKEYYDKWKNAKKDFDEKQLAAEKEAATTVIKKFRDIQDTMKKEMSDLTSEGKEAAQKLADEYARGQQSIMDAVNKPEKVTDINGNERLIFTNFAKKKQELEKYRKNLDKLGELGLSEQHLRDIFSMDLDTRMKYIEELLRMTDSNRQSYLRDYENYYAAAGQVSRQEAALSGAEADIMKDSIDTVFTDISDNSFIAGKQAKEQWLKGFTEAGGELGAQYAADLFGQPAPSQSAASDLPQNISINIAGQNVIKTTLSDFFKSLKNSGGVMDV